MKKESNRLLIPIILMMGFVPLIVRLYQYDCGLSVFDWFPSSSDAQADFFFAWKMIAIIIVGVIMIGIMVYRYLKKRDEWAFENAFYFLFFYGVFVIMAALFSQYKHWVIFGSYELFEPVWVVMAYILVCYYTYQYVRTEKNVASVLGWSGIGIAIVTLIGAFQAFGPDFFKSALGKALITPPSWWSNLDELNFTFDGVSYTTLYNPNFLSFYYGMLIPLIACLFIATKKKWQKVILVIAEIGSVICLKGSGADSGWMALVGGIGIVALIMLSRKKKTFIIGIAAAAAAAVLVIIVCVATPFGERLSNTIIGTYRVNETYSPQAIETGDDEVVLTIYGNKLSLSLDEQGDIIYKDGDGNLLETTVVDEENQIYQLVDEAYDGCRVQLAYLDSYQGFQVTLDDMAWNFVCVSGEGYYYVNSAGKLAKYKNADTANLFRDDAFSGRGAIWNDTIPLLLRHFLVGSGANTFVFEFPQDDYVNMRRVFGDNNFNVKAHSLYLQQGVETGVLGLVALLIFFAWYIVRSAKIYRRANLKESVTWVGIGLFAAVVVYLIAALANDSNVCTAPVFWVVLGLGFAVNRIVSESEGIVLKPVTEEEKEIEEVEEKTPAQPIKPKQTKKQSRKKRKGK